MIHELKCWPLFWDATRRGDKMFEVRRNDRDFRVGDFIALREWDPTTEAYTGRTLPRRLITYVMEGGRFGLAPDYCVLGLENRDG